MTHTPHTLLIVVLRALFLRQEAGAPEEQLESTLAAIDAAERRRSGAQVAS